MATMYQQVFGDRTLPTVLAQMIIGMRIDRIRDAWIEHDPTRPGEGRLAVYARLGGNNRKHWKGHADTPGLHCTCPGCLIVYRLPAHVLYLADQDDALDSTYTTVYFRLPKHYEDFPEPLARTAGTPDGAEDLAYLLSVLNDKNLWADPVDMDLVWFSAISDRALAAMPPTKRRIS